MLVYTLVIYLYMFGVILVSPFNKKARLMVSGRWNAFNILRRKIDKGARYVWFHAASLGEFEQGRPLMERFRCGHPEYKILLTFFSPSGYEVRKNYEGADVVCYLPFDTYGNVISFFRLVKPEMAFFIKYEFWLNFIRHCHRNNIPVYSISSIFRHDKIYFRWYGWIYATVLRFVTHFFVQDEESRRLLSTRGIEDNVSIVGDTRFDRVIDICKGAAALPLMEKFKEGGFVLVTGSSWPPDEDIVIAYFNTHPEMKLVLAPHVVSEDHLERIESRLKRPFMRYSNADEGNIGMVDALIVDCYGLLSAIYRYGDIAYVGGGFGAGIHNVCEAAVYGLPVLIGPNNRDFREAQALLRLGGCVEIHCQTDFDKVVDTLYGNPEALRRAGKACRNYIYDNAGASDAVFTQLGL